MEQPIWSGFCRFVSICREELARLQLLGKLAKMGLLQQLVNGNVLAAQALFRIVEASTSATRCEPSTHNLIGLGSVCTF